MSDSNLFSKGWNVGFQQAAQQVPETWATPHLELSSLSRKQGIYLRIHESQAEESISIREAAQTMQPDAITRCLGLSPVSLKAFYDRVNYLDPQWLNSVEQAEQVLELQVLKEQLQNRIEHDFPLMLDIAQSDYFLLVVQHGENRREHPVDVYLWDLRKQEQLLRVRTRARGTLIPVRIALGNNPSPSAPPPTITSGRHRLFDRKSSQTSRRLCGSRGFIRNADRRGSYRK